MQKQKFSAYFILMLLASLVNAPFTVQANPGSNTSETVSVSGLVEKPFTITIANIEKMNVSEHENAAVICDSGETRKTFRKYKGVLLREILDSAKVVIPDARQRGEYAVFIHSTDNYNVLFSYNELHYGTAGDNTWLIFEENGKPIEQDGRFVVFCANDKVTGPRHVKWVNRIEVLKINSTYPIETVK